MLTFDSKIPLPSLKLKGSRLRNCYFFGFDCFEYSESEVFFTDNAETINLSECIIFKLKEHSLVECYFLDSQVENSDCFTYTYGFSFLKEEFNSDYFLADVLKVDFNELSAKLNQINGK